MAKTDTAERDPEAEQEVVSSPADPVSTDHIVDVLQQTAPVKSPRFIPLVLGGGLAAVIGFASAYFLATQFPQVLGITGTAGLDQRLSDHDRRLTDLATILASLPEASDGSAPNKALQAEMTSTQESVMSLSKRQSDIESQIDVLSKKLDALAANPQSTTTASQQQIAAATESAVKEAKAAADEAAKAQSDAAAVARKALIQSAIAQIQVAMESGAAFDVAVTQLTQENVSVPDPLFSQEQGVPTMAQLRNGFAPAARDALSASLAETAGSSFWDRTTAFLRSQTGARSLTPRAGSDPDAVLSRAEAALVAGDLTAALDEIEALPPSGLARMSEWAALATRRLAAVEALRTLTAQIE